MVIKHWKDYRNNIKPKHESCRKNVIRLKVKNKILINSWVNDNEQKLNKLVLNYL